MKKSTMYTVSEILHGNTTIAPDALESARNDIDAEIAKNEAKINANRTLYATAHDIVMAHLDSHPVTCAELYEECKNDLPEEFKKGKLQYALREYWTDEIVVTGDTVNLYAKRQ